MTIKQAPLKCWDIYGMFLVNQAKHFNKQQEIEVLNTYKKEFGWVFNIEELITNNDFEAIILTNKQQQIEWVNKGFTKMIGYPANYAEGKHPSFLQGKNTTQASLESIRANLAKGRPFKTSIINYKKNGDAYNCHLDIYPLKDRNNNLLHLLALEKRIKM
ncbi:PAS domain-containing protein [Hyunsoonleella aestuarii]|nr:PAS domain-containing protein [Hyunsoonleella aestuarii]